MCHESALPYAIQLILFIYLFKIDLLLWSSEFSMSGVQSQYDVPINMETKFILVVLIELS
jgi:hypothetical protein